MNQKEIKHQWAKVRPKVKKQWSRLTKEELESASNGKLANLTDSLEKHYGYTRKEAPEKIEEFSRSLQ